MAETQKHPKVIRNAWNFFDGFFFTKMVSRDTETHEFSFELGPEIFFYFWIYGPYSPFLINRETGSRNDAWETNGQFEME